MLENKAGLHQDRDCTSSLQIVQTSWNDKLVLDGRSMRSQFELAKHLVCHDGHHAGSDVNLDGANFETSAPNYLRVFAARNCRQENYLHQVYFVLEFFKSL